MEATVVVATYGGSSWEDLAVQRAIPSAKALGVPVVHGRGSTLASARNNGLAAVETEWVVHLDADDELEPGYVQAMASGSADMRTPAIRQVRRLKVGNPFVPKVFKHKHRCESACLVDGNWLVIGTAVRTGLVREAGGWREYDWSEDWDMWLRCFLAGGEAEAVEGAVYRAHLRPLSRNRIPLRERLYWHGVIERANLPPENWKVDDSLCA